MGGVILEERGEVDGDDDGQCKGSQRRWWRGVNGIWGVDRADHLLRFDLSELVFRFFFSTSKSSLLGQTTDLGVVVVKL